MNHEPLGQCNNIAQSVLVSVLDSDLVHHSVPCPPALGGSSPCMGRAGGLPGGGQGLLTRRRCILGHSTRLRWSVEQAGSVDVFPSRSYGVGSAQEQHKAAVSVDDTRTTQRWRHAIEA